MKLIRISDTRRTTGRKARPRIEVVPSGSGEWYVRIKAANGETLAISETYTREDDADRGARAIRRAVLMASIHRAA